MKGTPSGNPCGLSYVGSVYEEEPPMNTHIHRSQEPGAYLVSEVWDRIGPEQVAE